MIICYVENRIRIYHSSGEWLFVMLCVPQGSILGSLLLSKFSVLVSHFLADLFFIQNDIDIVNLAHVNTPYLSPENLVNLMETLSLRITF